MKQQNKQYRYRSTDGMNTLRLPITTSGTVINISVFVNKKKSYF